MLKSELTEILETINLSKKEFAQLSNISYNTVNNWNDDNRPVPPWVESWLENYIQMRKFEIVKKTLRDSGVCKE